MPTPPDSAAQGLEKRRELWAKAGEHQEARLPRSEAETLREIEAAARADGSWAELARATRLRVRAEAEIEGGQPEETIRLLEAALAEAPAEIHPVLQSFLALAYWEYFQQNRWRLLERSRTAGGERDDLETWDLPRVLAEIDARWQAALENAAALQAIPVGDYDDLLVSGTVPDRFRPTLYDFLVHEALAFYAAGEQAGAAARDAFAFDAGSPALGGAEEFLAWNPEARDPSAPRLRALRLYQDLLRFHAGRGDRGPGALADLERIEWAADEAAGQDAGARALELLAALEAAHQDDEAGTAVAERLARRHFQAGDPASARRVALAAAERFPESVFAAGCLNLVRQIEAPTLEILTERVWNAAGPEIEVSYRNLEAVHFRLVPLEWRFGPERWDTPEQLGHDRIRELAGAEPALAWTEALEPSDDYRDRKARLPAPADQPPGFYLLLASAAPDFPLEDNRVVGATVWVSSLALVTRSASGAAEGFVLDARSGEPLPQARVEVWGTDRNGRWRRQGAPATDASGFFRHAGNFEGGLHLLVRHGNDSVASADEIYSWNRPRDDGETRRTFFFTDRAIYRPGQTIRFKGIHATVNQARDDYRAAAGQRLTIRLRDVNGEEVEAAEVVTNERGGFSGSFTAPPGRVTGQLTLDEGEGGGWATVRMEEYKRPRFQVTLDAPGEAPKLDEEVVLAGKAESYAGAPVDGAELRWRVTRETRWPDWTRWARWFFPPPHQGAQEIAGGVTVTGADGSFVIRFPALPDRGVDPRGEPAFTFAVHADVTDAAGETRSTSARVTAGYTALKAEMTAEEWQTPARPARIRVRAASLDGDPLPAEGTVSVHRLEAPEAPRRPPLGGGRIWGEPEAGDEPDLSDPDQWPLGEVVQRDAFRAGEDGAAEIEVKLAAGEYRAVLETRDRFGAAVTALLPLRVVDPEADAFPIPVPQHLSAPAWELEPGQEFEALWGTGYAGARAFVEIEHRGRMVQRYWTAPGRTQQRVTLPVTEAERGGFTLHLTQVRENRAHLTSRRVEVPWSSKAYSLRWEHLRSKLEPGAKETWTLVIEGAGEDLPAEMAATLYDASLDAFLPHTWPDRLDVFRRDHSVFHSAFHNRLQPAWHQAAQWEPLDYLPPPSWRHFPGGLGGPRPGRGMFGVGGGMRTRSAGREFDALGAAPVAAPAAMAMVAEAAGPADAFGDVAEDKAAGEGGAAPEPAVDWSQVAARENLEETAFFFPHLVAGEGGEVRMEFTMPEALTSWRFLGFAHDASLRSGLLSGEAVTSKDLMIQPNPPRFLREGDTVEFTATVSNRAARPLAVAARLELSDAETLESADAALGNAAPEQALEIPPGESRALSWRLAVPAGQGFLRYRALASAEGITDGEEGWLPVLSRRVLLTESLTLPLRGAGEKTFTLPKLLDSGASDSLSHHALTAQVMPRPAWHAVLSLPYLMEFPHECAEQVFNRFYANALARHIAGSDPRIRQVFDLWKQAQPEVLDSPLLKNEALKSVAIEETPWLRQARDETAARRDVGILFDANRLDHEAARALRRLEEMQIDTGAWPWFPGGRDNEFITLYVVAGFGRLGHLGVEIDDSLALRALDRLDAWIAERHRACLRDEVERFGSFEALYLYARSFFLERRPIAGEHAEAVDYFRRLAREGWAGLGSRMSQGHAALGLRRFGEAEAPAAIVASLRERAVSSEEMGLHWRDAEERWWWHRAPIETQAMMIEVFRDIAADAAAVEDCQVWLLKQRQTQAWPSTKSTADAVYALLLGGADLLAPGGEVTLSLGGQAVEAEGAEAGTGFFEKRFAAAEIRPEMGTARLAKDDAGVSWASLHWQYFEDLDRVTPPADGPLILEKHLFLRVAGPDGPALRPLEPGAKLAPGDELVSRLILRTDRDLEFVHLKDQRGSGTEPLKALSGYRFQDGLAYYESIRDTASHFFIEYLPRGNHVFESGVRVQLRGLYQSGVAEIQCLYAPEFNSHSGSFALEVE